MYKKVRYIASNFINRKMFRNKHGQEYLFRFNENATGKSTWKQDYRPLNSVPPNAFT